jgi:hypothetical protein
MTRRSRLKPDLPLQTDGSRYPYCKIVIVG